MATLNTSQLELPGTSLGIVVSKASEEGILGKLSPEKPTLFGPVSGGTFQGNPRAEIVGESEAKSGQDVTITPFKADPVKFHVGLRVSDEFLWADDDYRLGVIDDMVAPALGTAIGRAGDLFAFHGINPKTGTVSPKATKYLSQATNVVEAAGKPTDELVAAVGLAIGGAYMPNGIAIDGGYAFDLATEQYADGRDRNPGMGFGQGLSGFKGLSAASSTTVSGRPEMTDSTIRAIVGDYKQVRWGFQRRMPIELIRYGDPDNTGRDLAGHNEVFLRTEAVVYVAIGDLAAFSLVKDAVA